MRVVVAGSSGLIGTALVAHLRAAGTTCCAWSAGSPPRPTSGAGTRPRAGSTPGTFDGVDAVVNLNGVGIADRPWSGARRQPIRDSRNVPTEVLAARRRRARRAGAAQRVGHRLLRRHRRRRAVDESAPSGAGFLAERRAATGRRPPQPARDAGARVVLLRTGLVLSPSGGLLGPLRLVFRFALGGRIGPGTQYMPWISLDDEVGAIRFLLENGSVDGPVNLAGPTPVTNAEFTAALATALHRPAPFAVPAAVHPHAGRVDGRGDAALRAARGSRRSWRRPATGSGTGPSTRRSRPRWTGPEPCTTSSSSAPGWPGCARRRCCAAAGSTWCVLDAADRPGGRVATDVVDGFRCDRGFQVLNTSYPALRAAADLDALDLRAFTPAAAVRGGRRRCTPTATRGGARRWRPG